MDCKKAHWAVYLFYDNELAEDDRSHFQAHLEHCPPCAQQARYVERFLWVVRRRCGRCSAPERLHRRIRVGLPHRQAEHRDPGH